MDESFYHVIVPRLDRESISIVAPYVCRKWRTLARASIGNLRVHMQESTIACASIDYLDWLRVACEKYFDVRAIAKCAAMKGRSDILLFLLSHGWRDYIPVMYYSAAQGRQVAILDWLTLWVDPTWRMLPSFTKHAMRGGDHNDSIVWGRTYNLCELGSIMHYCAKYGALETLKKIGVRDEHVDEVLMQAIYSNQLHIVEYLYKPCYNERIIELAYTYNRPNIVA